MDGRGLNDIRDHIGASATAANILVQMTNDPLDVIISGSSPESVGKKWG